MSASEIIKGIERGMERGFSLWEGADPRAMADNQSRSAIYFTLSDAKKDIAHLRREIELLVKQLEAITA